MLGDDDDFAVFGDGEERHDTERRCGTKEGITHVPKKLGYIRLLFNPFPPFHFRLSIISLVDLI
jgi:hypothetical protein